MPIYEYQCDACGRRFEQIQKFADAPADTCPECGKGPVHRLLSSPAIQFKGAGWYVTDYARKSGAPAGTKESGDGAKSAAGAAAASTSSESKPAATEAPAAPKPESKKD